MPQALYELTFTLHQPPQSKLLYTNAMSAPEALVSLLDEYEEEVLKSLVSISVAIYNPSTGEFDDMDLKPECEAFVQICRSL